MWDGWYRYEKSTPKTVKGGIKAQTKKGAFAQKWWGERWIHTLESFNIGARLSRGKSYARGGQVAHLEIQMGKVSAQVQGSRSTPYSVSIQLKSFSQKEWDRILEKLTEQPLFTAQLLGNEMPHEIESVFKKMGFSLFPQKMNDMETDCSCPDWSNPCKHIAAVFYLMAEAFDTDPFLLFRLRGMDRERFLKSLQESEGAPVQTVQPEPLPIDPLLFWGEDSGEAPHLSLFPVQIHSALPKRLGNLPFWRSEKNFMQEMEWIYQRASGHIEARHDSEGG